MCVELMNTSTSTYRLNPGMYDLGLVTHTLVHDPRMHALFFLYAPYPIQIAVLDAMRDITT
jgi:hypothetical protein